MKKSLLSSVIFLLISVFLNGQDFKKQKILNIKRSINAPKIDAILDDAAWSEAQKCTDFYMKNPGDGTPERQGQNTEVYMTYDDVAIYVAARIYINPINILKELGPRDGVERNTDLFIFSINPYNDGQQVFNFILTAAGVQIDTKYTSGNDDINWNAVWDSEVNIDDKGWTLEMKIPYSELRFPQGDKPWAVNFLRSNKYLNEEYTWNYIDKSVGDFVLHYALLDGIRDVKTPVRLSFMPYISSYYNNYNQQNTFSYNGGMDLKYGVNDAFTMDVTLIPDFGQAAFDKHVLNLGPFEVQYDENRPFFTEGTELFSKGDLFYSRRIGNAPVGYNDAYSSLDSTKEELISNPSTTALINASKISGRTKNGLGIGIFNAITDVAKADYRQKGSGEIRHSTTEPVANYNLLVLDQRFNKNSYVSFVNSNVLRRGNYRDANVSAFLFDISNSSNSYKVLGAAKYSSVSLPGDSIKSGYEGQFGFAKIKGNWRFEHLSKAISKHYDNSDLGFMTTSNVIENETEFSYQIFEPNKVFNNMDVSLSVNHDRRLDPDHYIKTNLRMRSRFTTTDFFSFGFNAFYQIGDMYDYFEPRVDGRFLLVPSGYFYGGWISTDYRKMFSVDFWTGTGSQSLWGGKMYDISISPRLRVNDRLFIMGNVSKEINTKDLGWVNNLGGNQIVMGFRERINITSSIAGSYIFNKEMSVNLSFRHYWVDLKYIEFAQLANNGELISSAYSADHNASFNSWNMDLNFSWWYAPGSQLSLLYRNSLLSNANKAGFSYFQNLENLFDEPFDNTISFRLTYFLDYNSIAR